MFKLPLTDVVKLSAWVWEHRQHFPGVPSQPDKYLETVTSHRGHGVHRVGSKIVFDALEAGTQVLAFLGQTSHQLSDIERAVSDADAAQPLHCHSLASLKAVSMVTLGLTAISPSILAAQFTYLRKRFNDLQKDIRNLQKLLEDRYIAELESGLEMLDSGVRQSKKERIESALQKCNESAVFFANRVHSAVNEEQDRRAILMLSRHLAVAICGTTRCYIALEEDAEARKAIATRRQALLAAAKAVFEKTLGRDPERFLVPELAGHTSLESLAMLFRQATYVGAVDRPAGLPRAPADQAAASQLFDTLRGRLFKPKWAWSRVDVKALKEELRDATASLEETSRVLSLAESLEQARKTDTRAIDAVAWFGQQVKEGREPYFAWGF
jgi:hypothetical protein